MTLDFHKNHRLLFGTVFGLFLALSGIIAVGPALWVQNNNRPLPDSRPLTVEEANGLQVYLSEGCVYCHTQQVRPIPQDTSRYGRASAPGDYARLRPRDLWRQTPSVLGTERTGPDLSAIGDRQPSDIWHHIHLYQPRAVVGASMMPSFPWLYETKAEAAPGDVVVPVPESHGPDGGVVVARPRARALVAYLLALKQAPLPGTTSTVASPGSSGASGEALGARVYGARCASCHQAGGEGVPGVYPPLLDDPVVLADDPTRHIEIVLFGLSGETIQGTTYPTVMPGWAEQLSDEEVAAVVNHERRSWGHDAPTTTADEVARVRRGGPPDER